MKLATIKTGLFGSGALLLAASIVISGLMLSPSSASAHWWPWGHNHANAQETDDNETVNVTIHKYIDGEMATSENADGKAFPMNASWDDPDGLGKGSGGFELSADTSPAYQAMTEDLQVGADYSVSETLDGDTVAASCDSDHPYALVGYSIGATAEAATTADSSTDAPAFTGLGEDQHVIVWNKSCADDDDDTHATSSGSLSGEVTGGSSDDDPGDLSVTSVDAEKTTAVANGEFADGWKYVFNITVPSDEPNLAMKFADWMQTDGDHTLPVADNMRISSDQASSSSAVTLTADDTYSSPALMMTGDLDTEKDGMQVQVLVEVAVPADTYNGTYSTTYGVQTLP